MFLGSSVSKVSPYQPGVGKLARPEKPVAKTQDRQTGA